LCGNGDGGGIATGGTRWDAWDAHYSDLRLQPNYYGGTCVLGVRSINSEIG